MIWPAPIVYSRRYAEAPMSQWNGPETAVAVPLMFLFVFPAQYDMVAMS